LAQASAAALWIGNAGIDPETGASLTGPAPHLSVEGGCVGCHRDGPAGIEHGASHGFRADRRQCASCHEDPTHDAPQHDNARREAVWDEERTRIEKEVRDRWADLAALGALPRGQSDSAEPTSGPPHAAMPGPWTPRTPLGRAAYDLSLLLEDRGFFAHNLPYARMLLAKAKVPIERAMRAAERRDEQGSRR
jgi:hypothetical protein